jgi:hypothetical protein
MLRLLTLLALIGCGISSASAQIIYEPVQYQYGTDRHYYYGGNDPSVFRAAEQYSDGGGQFGRVHGFAWVSANVMTHREVSTEAPRIYADSMPRTNAAIYGYSMDDARNEAYANVPRYFRMRDLLPFAVPDEGGSLHVPAQLPMTSDGSVIEIKPYVRKSAPTTGVSTGSIIIIPKHLLQEQKPQAQQVALTK